MNVDAKILNKYKQTEYSNASKSSYTMIKWNLFRDDKVVTLASQ